MPKCCVPTCKNAVKDVRGFPFFTFPNKKCLKNRWLEALKISPLININENTRVCSLHFEEGDMFRFSTTTKLKLNRIPHLSLASVEATFPTEDLNDEKCKANSKKQKKSKRRPIFSSYASPPPFAIERFWKKDKKICRYTGLPSHKVLMIIYNFVFKCERGQKGSVHVTDSKTSLVKCHKLSPLNEFFLTLIKLRKGIDYHMLGDMFWISESAACRVFNAWINLLYTKLGSLKLFPHRRVLMKNAPKEFVKKYPKVIGSIDCTEFMIESPSSLVRQSQCFSNYKGCNTLKSLIMISGNGAIIFVSALHTGSISDKQIVHDSGFLPLLRKKMNKGELEEGDIILADKGFNIKDLLDDIGIELNIPTFRISGIQFLPDEVEYIRKISHERVHVERAIRRLKIFKVLSNKVPISLLGIINQIYTVCAILTNFRRRLRS